MRRKTTWLVLITLILAFSYLLSPIPRRAKAASFSVCAVGCDFTTIQAAVNAADATAENDTITVQAGTYAEIVTIPASEPNLTINGPNVNVSGCGARVGEAVVGNTSGAFQILANNTVINGFTMQGNTNGAFLGAGVSIGGSTTGVQLLNNIIQNNIVGVFLGGDNTIIRGNLIQNNNNPGPASGNGIYTDQFVAGGTLSNSVIDANCFTNNGGAALAFSSTDALAPATGIQISDNTFTGNARAFFMFSVTSSSFTGNTVSGSTFTGSADLRIFEGVNGLLISENFLSNAVGTATFRAVRISNIATGAPDATAITMNCNSITNYSGAGLELDAGAYSGTLNAEENWWGSATGPTIASNPGGTGEEIIDPDLLVDYNPFKTIGSDFDPTVTGFQCGCALTCPANITQSNDPNQCGAVVTYPAPTIAGECGTVTCSPASGSFFPVGTTTVTCTPTEDAPSCTFTVTVNDTQPPSITCPANQTVTGAPDTTSAVGTYPAPTASDNCPGVTPVCTPASGSTFPQGTTTVTCTATDNSGNTATCSFTMTVNIPPGANNDHYFTLLNQPLTVPAPGVLSNDTGFPAPTAVPASGSTSAGGTFTLTFNGQVTYTPPPGFTGNDGFNYTATNIAGSDTAHVTLTVTDPATIFLRISEFRENGPGAGFSGPGIKSELETDSIISLILNPARDEFIEIYNHTPTDVQVGTTLPSNSGGLGVFASAGNGVTDNVVTLVCKLPDGTIIPAKGYVLCTNSGPGGGYSMNSFGFRGSRTGSSNPSNAITGSGQTAVGDFPIINGTAAHPGAFTAVDIPNDAGLLLANVGDNTVGASINIPDNGDFGFGATGVSPASFTVYDRIGFAPYGSGAPLQTCQLVNTAGCGSSGSARPSLADNYCEGGPTGCLRPVGDASTTNHGSAVFYGDSGQYSLLRRQTTLNALGTAPQDTNNNVQDILMVAPKPGINIAFNITNFPTGATNGLVSVLGAAGPQNRKAPPDLPDPGVLQSRLFDTGRTLNQLPNAERRYVIDNGGSPENAGNMNTTIQANNPLGSFIFRFGFRNVSPENLLQLRFRVDQLAVPCGQASPSPTSALTGSGNARNLSQTSPNCQGSDTQTAVLKVLNMPTEVVDRESAPGTPETVRGSLIEDTGNSPGGVELAPNGGGINNSLVRTGTNQGSFTGEYTTLVPAGGPYFYIGFRLGVVRGGSFKFIIQPEGGPSPVAVPDSMLLLRHE